ncbi:MAG: solute-binding protein, partial [bacterium]|nr:solute-binding protein [bacterium]
MKLQQFYKSLVIPVSIILLIIVANTGCGERTEEKRVKNKAVTEEKNIMIGAGKGLEPVLEPLRKAFTEKTGIKIETLYLCAAMSQPDLIKTWDVMLPGEEHFIQNAVKDKLIDPKTVSIVGEMIPVIAVQKGNPENITGIEDLARPGLKLGMG